MDDFPLPVLPTTPTFAECLISRLIFCRAGSASGKYLFVVFGEKEESDFCFYLQKE
jgi:hypothetical protein